MRPFARIMIVALLAVFAVASTVHAAGTVVMDLKMAMAPADSMDMDECDGRGDGGGNPPCDTVCGALLLAMASPDAPLQDAAPQTFDRFGGEGILGRTGPPDPYPPRFLVLS